MSELAELVRRCKASVTVTVNDHRDYYQTVEDWLKERIDRELADGDEITPEEITPEKKAKMIETDTIVCVHFYPNTPVGFNLVYHYDVDMAITEALESLGEEK